MSNDFPKNFPDKEELARAEVWWSELYQQLRKRLKLNVLGRPKPNAKRTRNKLPPRNP